RHRVLDQILTAMIAKAGDKSIHQIDRAIGRAEQQPTRIRRHQRTTNSRHDAPSDGAAQEIEETSLCSCSRELVGRSCGEFRKWVNRDGCSRLASTRPEDDGTL